MSRITTLIIIACFAVEICVAFPSKGSQSFVLDILKDLDDTVEQDGNLLIYKVQNLINHIKDTVHRVKEIVPKVYTKIHIESDEIIKGLQKVAEEFKEMWEKKNVMYGFDLLNGLTELSGGTKLSTVLQLLSLADKAHRVISDAKEFIPHLEDTLQKIQIKIQAHVQDFAFHVLKELDVQDIAAKSVVNKIEELFEKAFEEEHLLILDLLQNMEQTFNILQQQLPKIYKEVQKDVEDVKFEIHKLLSEIEKTLKMRSFSVFDIAGNVGDGTSLGTAFKVMSLLDKFNTVVQDVKNFGPNAEILLQHSVKRVADSAKNFFSHAANSLVQ